MERINVIPYPRSVVLTGGEIAADFALNNITEKTVDGLDAEGYILEVTEKGVGISSSSGAGAFYARRTLEQLAAGGEIPCCKIEDSPRFPYRGFMIDTVRHISTVEETKRLLDAAASLKLNALHWHLSDDQGWRVQIDSLPLLTEKGSKRKASLFGGENDHSEYGGFFTKAEIKEVVAYAAERFIRVIPEIDMPGHTSAMLHAYPELSCTGEQIEVVTKQGVYPDILCAGKEGTFETVFKVLDEMTELFPDEMFHIGGDEAPKRRWKTCPDCQRKIKELGLENEEELQRWFVIRLKEYLESKGKKAVVWNESLKAGNIDGVTVQRWMDGKHLSEKFANGGGKVIMSDFYHYYLDYPYAMTPLSKTYNYEPTRKHLTEEGKKNVIGIEAPLWAEYVLDFERWCFMGFPRLAAAAETGWSRAEDKELKDFERRFEAYEPLLKTMGITPAPKNEWNVSAFKRLPGIWKFFKPVVKNK